MGTLRFQTTGGSGGNVVTSVDLTFNIGDAGTANIILRNEGSGGSGSLTFSNTGVVSGFNPDFSLPLSIAANQEATIHFLVNTSVSGTGTILASRSTNNSPTLTVNLNVIAPRNRLRGRDR